MRRSTTSARAEQASEIWNWHRSASYTSSKVSASSWTVSGSTSKASHKARRTLLHAGSCTLTNTMRPVTHSATYLKRRSIELRSDSTEIYTSRRSSLSRNLGPRPHLNALCVSCNEHAVTTTNSVRRKMLRGTAWLARRSHSASLRACHCLQRRSLASMPARSQQ